MKIVNFFKGNIPSNIADAHISIMEVMNLIPEHYKSPDIDIIDWVVVTDCSYKEYLPIAAESKSMLGSIFIESCFGEETDLDFLRVKFLQQYAKSFIVRNEGLVDVIKEQARALPKALITKLKGLSPEELFSNLFPFFILNIIEGNGYFIQSEKDFYKRIDQQVRFGHIGDCTHF